MRLSGPIFEEFNSPDEWVSILKNLGYNTTTCPFGPDENSAVIDSYMIAAKNAGITIAEVGAWSNPISSDHEQRRQAILSCQKNLDLADRIGALCCVNIAGSRGEQWDGPHMNNLNEETFEMIVDSVREIIDVVKPERTFYTLETMPWIFPDSPDSYLKLIKAIDRKAFAVHLDVVNFVNSPQRFFNNAQLIKDCFKQLGPYIKSCHAKDITLGNNFMVHLDEVCPGKGSLDYKVYISELGKLDKNIPLVIEHLNTKEEVLFATNYIREVAKKVGVVIY